MQWQEIRKHYPRQWLLIEAFKACTKDNKRILEDISVIATFSDSVKAMQHYTRFYRQSPERESPRNEFPG